VAAKEKARAKKWRSIYELSSRLFTSPVYEFIVREKRWLLQERGVPFPALAFLFSAGETFPQIFKTIIAKKRKQARHFEKYKCFLTTEPAIPLLNLSMKIAQKNQALRSTLGSLARCLIRSKLTPKNTEDLMTGEIPVCPISLVDMKTRSHYTFEASTILRDMVARLSMSHCTFFPNPKKPRNPYTNEILSEGQFYSVAQQLRRSGTTHWTIEALYSSKYNLKEFEADMYTKLKRCIHNSIFANPSSDVAKEVLLEYIEDEHSHHKKIYEREIYEWALEHMSHHFRVHEWRIQCGKFYKMVHFPDTKDDVKTKITIDAATQRLCMLPALLIKEYETAHKKTYIPLLDRVSVVQLHTIINAGDLAAIMTVYANASDSESDDSTGEED
jgi:hypothetical protein